MREKNYEILINAITDFLSGITSLFNKADWNIRATKQPNNLRPGRIERIQSQLIHNRDKKVDLFEGLSKTNEQMHFKLLINIFKDVSFLS